MLSVSYPHFYWISNAFGWFRFEKHEWLRFGADVIVKGPITHTYSQLHGYVELVEGEGGQKSLGFFFIRNKVILLLFIFLCPIYPILVCLLCMDVKVYVRKARCRPGLV